MTDSIARYTYSDLNRSRAMLIWRTIRKVALPEGAGVSTETVGNVTIFVALNVGHQTAMAIHDALKDDCRMSKFDYYYREEW